MKMPEIIVHKLDALLGQKKTLCRVAYDKSLFLGFGEISRSGKFEVPHGEWEIVSYDSSWRFVRPAKLLLGRYELDSTFTELNERVHNIRLGCFMNVCNLTEFDVRFNFTCETSVDFMSTSGDGEDAVVRIFMPEQEIIKYSPRYGWQMGRSDLPWQPYLIDPKPPDDSGT